MERESGVEECAWGLLTLGSSGTGAFVGIDQVNAGAPVLARLGETFIDLIRAVGPDVAWYALRGRKHEQKKAKKEEEEKKKMEQKKRGESLINV